MELFRQNKKKKTKKSNKSNTLCDIFLRVQWETVFKSNSGIDKKFIFRNESFIFSFYLSFVPIK